MHSDPIEIPDFTAHELLSSYQDGLKEAVDFTQTVVIPTLKGQINYSNQEAAVIGIFYRIHSLASSLMRLNQKSDFNTVAIVARTIFELLIDIKILSSDKITRQQIEQFHSFPEIDRYRKAKRIVELQDGHPELANNSLLDSVKRRRFVEKDSQATQIEKKVVSLWGRTKKQKIKWPNNWSGISIWDRAKGLGPLYEQEYLEIYSLLSSYTHGGSAAYFNMSEKALESVYGISLEYARKMYIESIIMCSQVFKLQKGIKSFDQIVTFLKDAPEKILVEYGLKKIDKYNKNKA